MFQFGASTFVASNRGQTLNRSGERAPGLHHRTDACLTPVPNILRKLARQLITLIPTLELAITKMSSHLLVRPLHKDGHGYGRGR